MLNGVRENVLEGARGCNWRVYEGASRRYVQVR